MFWRPLSPSLTCSRGISREVAPAPSQQGKLTVAKTFNFFVVFVNILQIYLTSISVKIIYFRENCAKKSDLLPWR